MYRRKASVAGSLECDGSSTQRTTWSRNARTATRYAPSRSAREPRTFVTASHTAVSTRPAEMAADTIAATLGATLADGGCSVHGPVTSNDTGRPSSEAASTRSVSVGHIGALPCQVTTESAKNGGVRPDGAIANACM